MALTNFINGTLIKSSEVDSNLGHLFEQQGINHIMQLVDRSVDYSAGAVGGWGEAYIDADGRNDSVDATATTATFNTDRYNAGSFAVVIEATSLTLADFQINNCDIRLLQAGRWALYSTADSSEDAKSNVMMTLYFGSDGTDPRATSTYITGLTALKVSDSNWVGRNAYQIYSIDTDTDIGQTRSNTMTLADQTNNSNMDICMICDTDGATSDYKYRLEAPTSTILYDFGSSGNYERKIETVNNVPTVTQRLYSATNNNAITRMGTIIIYDDTAGAVSGETVDFKTTHSTPNFTAITTELDDLTWEVWHDMPSGTFPDSVTSAVGVPYLGDWEDGVDIQYKLQGYEDPEDGTSYLTNPSFESALTTGWTVLGGTEFTITQASDKAQSGTYSLKSDQQNTTNNNDEEIVEQTIALGTGRLVSINLWNWMNVHNGTGALKVLINDDVVYTRSRDTGNGGTLNDTEWLNTGDLNVQDANYTGNVTIKVRLEGNGYYTGGRDFTCWVDNITLVTQQFSGDTGWLACGNTPVITNFTSLTNPTKLAVKLIPKSSDPSDGVPSLKGFWLTAK